MDINFELYKVFFYVAKYLSFSEASKKLFISQSAVSQSVKILEKRLNQTLFVRTTKKVILTKEGELLFKHIEPAIHLIMRGENQLLEAHSLTGGQLRIAASDTICRYFLIPYLKQFHKTYPEIHLKVMNASSTHCVELLNNNEADLIITNFPNPKLQSMEHVVSLCPFQDIFAVNPAFYPELTGHPVSLEQLQNYPILMLERNSTTSRFLHQLFLENQLDLIPAIELSSNDLLMDLAEIGLGAAFIPQYCLKDNTSLSIIKLKTVLPERKLVAAYNDLLPLPIAARQFLSSLTKHI